MEGERVKDRWGERVRDGGRKRVRDRCTETVYVSTTSQGKTPGAATL
jgi:hypothetical protein